jgi:hypothetical protein
MGASLRAMITSSGVESRPRVLDVRAVRRADRAAVADVHRGVHPGGGGARGRGAFSYVTSATMYAALCPMIDQAV